MKIRAIDTLEFGIEVDNYIKKFEDLLIELAKLKKESQDTNQNQLVRINGINFDVAKSGAPFYTYRLECKDFFLYFQERPMKNNPPIRVKLLSSFLWSYGYKEAYNNFINWIDDFNIPFNGTKISRVDICLDTDEFIFKEEDIKNFATRARHKEIHYPGNMYLDGKKFSGFTIGKGKPLLVRIYDKSLEIYNSKKIWFKNIWNLNNWNKDKAVWRVEFQLRRSLLKEFKINSVEDYLIKEDQIWAYLTKKWIMLKELNDTNISRCKIDKRWEKIQIYNNKINVEPIIREKVKEGNVIALLDQSSGLALSIGALYDYKDLDETFKTIKTYTEIKLIKKETFFEEEKEKRRLKYLH
jgi:hypothetical protein